MRIRLPLFITNARIILALYLLLITAAMHGQIASGVVYSDRLRVRNAPNLQAETVDHINAHTRVDIYECSGMAHFNNRAPRKTQWKHDRMSHEAEGFL